MNYSKNILLTGAGFTKNFDGFLAEEMWAQILNHTEVQKNWELVEKMQQEFEYENIYYEIMQGDKPHLRGAIQTATMDAYENLDSIIRGMSGFAGEAGIYALLNLFSGKADEINCFFTLNQDLLIERRFSESLSKELELPGLNIEFWKFRGSSALSEEHHIISLPKDTIDLKLSERKFNYIKLHGSYNWRGLNPMVIGSNKKEAIDKEPLLKKYFEIFKEAISRKGTKLLVIGYGFCDEHINQIIYDSINSIEDDNEKLRLYVLSPENPASFRRRLCKHSEEKILKFMNSKADDKMSEFKNPKGNTIYSRLSGFFQCDLKNFKSHFDYESKPYFKMITRIFT